MNIFYFDPDPKVCAKEHCDKHLVKMIVEYAQLLSSNYRFLEGELYFTFSTKGKKVKRYLLEEPLESKLYKATHLNHPSSLWTRESSLHYQWLFKLYCACCAEYTKRYGKSHASETLKPYLENIPPSLGNKGFHEPPCIMGEEYIVKGNTIESYRNYYREAKAYFTTWKIPAEKPEWMN